MAIQQFYETYNHIGNVGQLFEIKSRPRKAKEGEKNVTHYYTDLKTLWHELDLYQRQWRKKNGFFAKSKIS